MPARRRGLTTSGLDTVIPRPPDPADFDQAAGVPSQPPAPTRPEKVKLGGYYDHELAERIRNTVAATVGHPHGPRGLSEFLVDAAEREVARLQAERNDGQPFPQRTHRKLLTGPRPD